MAERFFVWFQQMSVPGISGASGMSGAESWNPDYESFHAMSVFNAIIYKEVNHSWQKLN